MSGLELLAPAGLLALIGLPLVVLIHMRQTTPIVREVPSLRFWRIAAQEERDTDRFRRPPITLLLILHLLLVLLLGIALARPAASRALGGFGARAEPRHLIILLDGSTSMAAVNPESGQTRFDAAREIAIDHLGALRQGDVATVILMGTHASTYEATDEAGRKSVQERLSRVGLPGGRADLDAALNLTSNLLLPSMDDEIVVITDGAVSADPAIVAKIGAPIELVMPAGWPSENVAITEIATRSSTATPGQQQLYARIVNFGSTAVTVPVVISADGIDFSHAEVTIEPNGEAQEIVQDLPAGALTVEIRVDVLDALAADNVASSVLTAGSEFGLRILYVYESVPTPLQRALAVMPGAQLTMLTPVEANALDLDQEFDLVVYEHTLPPGAWPNVPVLIVNPPEGGDVIVEGIMPAPKADRIRAQDPLLRGVELAGVTFGQTLDHVLDATATEIVGAIDGPLIYRASAPKSAQPMVVLAFDVAQSNLPRRVAFPILIANIVGELAPSPLPSAAPLGEPLDYRPRPGAAVVRVTPPLGEPLDLQVASGTDAASGPGERLLEVTFADTGLPGTYLVTELDAGDNPIGSGRFVINAGHPRESDLTPNADLASVLASAQATGDAGSTSVLEDLWPLLAFAAFVLLLIEWGATLLPRRRRRMVRPATPLPV